MKRFMFGLDENDYAGSAKTLAGEGYDAVVLPAGNPDAFACARNAGLETWLCYSAHGLSSGDPDTYGAVDAMDRPAPWFGSACPNCAEVSERNLSAALEFASKIEGLSGIIVDGARFASFASEEGIDSFSGCFCRRCMSKMNTMGIDADSVKSGIKMLMGYLNGEEGSIPTMRTAIDGWFDFRAACVKEYMDSFAARAHERGLKAGAFVFAPSLWWFVGQRPDSCAALDLVSPMIYRAYPHETGTACLSHEWAGFYELLSHSDSSASDLASLIFDMAFPSDDPMAGFSPEHVGFEVKAARAQLRNGIELAPIIQIEDPLLDKTRAAVMASGADGCGEFMYAQKPTSVYRP